MIYRMQCIHFRHAKNLSSWHGSQENNMQLIWNCISLYSWKIWVILRNMPVTNQKNHARLYTPCKKLCLILLYSSKLLHILVYHFLISSDSPFSLISVLYNLQVRFCDRNDIYTYCGKSYKFIFMLKYLRSYGLYTCIYLQGVRHDHLFRNIQCILH